ncbi:MAG: helix-turn-helix transcriptional regulator [Bacteroidales bacterium]|nr:helix-turn-helix transcriptional regulator [Bacteroidales bacterium]
MNRRLLQFLQAENITQAQLADTLSVARGSVSHILAGRNRPGYDFLESLLLHYPSLNLDWLMTGRGKMYRGEDSKEGAEDAQLNLFTPLQSPVEARRIEKITVFYTDSSFQDFIAKE